MGLFEFWPLQIVIWESFETVSIYPKCPVCGSKFGELWARAQDIEYKTTDEIFDYYRCCTCNCLFLEPMPKDRLSEIYPSNYYSYIADKGVLWKIKNLLDRKMFHQLTSGQQSKDLRILDVGGGTGTTLDAFIEAVGPVAQSVVVDIDTGAAVRAKAKGHTFVPGPVESFHSDIKFHIIFMKNIIEHVENPAEVLLAVAKLLTPDGRIYIQTPNWDALDHRIFRHRSWGGLHCPRHWVLFTMPGFEALVKKCRLDIAQSKYIQGAPFWAVNIVDMLSKIGLTRITRNRPVIETWAYKIAIACFAPIDIVSASVGRKTSQMTFILTSKIKE